jgi:hypothetical protein
MSTPGEIAIVIGLIIIIVMMVIYSRSKTLKPCDEYITYFDKMYYNIPQINTIDNRYDSLNDDYTPMRIPPATSDDSNAQASRWAGSIDSQPGYNINNIKQNYNMDVSVEPRTLQSSIKSRQYLSDLKNKNSCQNEGFLTEDGKYLRMSGMSGKF